MRLKMRVYVVFVYWVIFFPWVMQSQIFSGNDGQNIIASRLEGKWEMSAFLTQRLQATSYPMAAPVEFMPAPYILSKISTKYQRQLDQKQIYFTGLMKTALWERAFILVEENGNPSLVVFIRKDDDPIGSTEVFFIMLAMAKNPKDDILFIKSASDTEPFIALERSQRYTPTAHEEKTDKKKQVRKYPNNWYCCMIDKKYAGYLYWMRRDSGNTKAPVAFSYKIAIHNRGIPLAQDLVIFAQEDAYYSPVQIVCKGKEGLPSFIANVNSARKLTTILFGRPYEIELPVRTVFAPIIWDIVTNLPFNTEEPFKFHMLEVEELILKMDHKITYIGLENLVIEGEIKKLHKFIHTGEGVAPVYYWLDEEHELVRVLMGDDREFLLTTKERAMRH